MAASSKASPSRVTCIDIARMVGVAPSTVSRVINDSQRVSADTRRRVMNAIAATGYRPSLAASSLPRRRHDTIGLITESTAHGSYGPELIRGVSVALTASGQRLAINMISDLQPAEALEGLPLFQSVSVDGLILDVCNTTGDIDAVIGRLRTPAVFVNAPSPRPFNTVMPDDEHVARRATEYLIERGHRKIGYLPNCQVPHSSHPLRMNGYAQAMLKRGLGPLPMWDAALEHRPALFAERLAMLRSHGATAVVTYNGIVAAYAVRACVELKFKIPDELSIVACDYDPVAEFTVVPVTCFRLDRAEMGRLAVGMLAERIEHPSRNVKSIFLSGELVELASVQNVERKN